MRYNMIIVMIPDDKRKKINFLAKVMKYEDSNTKIQTFETPTRSIVKKEIKLPTGKVLKSIESYTSPISETTFLIQEKDKLPFSVASDNIINWTSPTFVNREV